MIVLTVFGEWLLMSKERLEDKCRVVDDLLNNRAELTNFVNDYYLQAEQASRSTETIIELGKKIDRLQSENFRYREQLESIHNFVKGTIFETLEGESSEKMHHL